MEICYATMENEYNYYELKRTRSNSWVTITHYSSSKISIKINGKKKKTNVKTSMKPWTTPVTSSFQDDFHTLILCLSWRWLEFWSRMDLLYEKIFANHISDEDVVSKYVKNSYSSSTNRQTTQFKNRQGAWTDISSNKIYSWSTSTWKGAQHH